MRASLPSFKFYPKSFRNQVRKNILPRHPLKGLLCTRLFAYNLRKSKLFKIDRQICA